mmetsp:Transcript_14112/g.21435  ORF Transcript_14112/g.21435 Transcript_14112/m.21435 type:complete len:251 (-) Transcript_14112:88-840(-)
MGTGSFNSMVFLSTFFLFAAPTGLAFVDLGPHLASPRGLPPSGRCLKQGLLKMELEAATFSMGCFWAPQEKFDALKGQGVISTSVGYTGGTNPNPSYQSVCNGDGHVETVRITFDNDLISYQELLEVFWEQELAAMQIPKRQYAHIIWACSPLQKQTATAKLNALAEKEDPRVQCVQIEDCGLYYEAEQYHQTFWEKQRPWFALLAVSVVLRLFPGTPSEIQQIALGVNLMYLFIFGWERLAGSKVRVVE